jgi:hypothetical protein
MSIPLAALPRAKWRRTVLAYAKERLFTRGEKRLESHAQRGPHGQLNRTKPPPLDGPAVGRNTFWISTGRGAFRGMSIWEIPANRSSSA